MFKRLNLLCAAVLGTMVGAALLPAQGWSPFALQVPAATDGFRHCSSYLPDSDGLEACLHRQEGRASSPYATLLRRHVTAAIDLRTVSRSPTLALEN